MQLSEGGICASLQYARDWLCKPSLRLVGKEKRRVQETSSTEVFGQERNEVAQYEK